MTSLNLSIVILCTGVLAYIFYIHFFNPVSVYFKDIKYPINPVAVTVSVAGIRYLYMWKIFTLKYSQVSTRHKWTGESKTPANPQAKINMMFHGVISGSNGRRSGKLNPTKATVRPVTSPLKKGTNAITGSNPMLLF